MSLHPLQGHLAARTDLARARLAGTLPASLLFHGPRGIGKQRLALWLAETILCGSPGDAGACGRCQSCRMAARLEHPDIHWYFPLPRPKGASSPEKMADALEEARYARLAELRETPLRTSGSSGPTGIYIAAARSLRRRAQSRPSMSSAQVFIIGDAETLVPQEASPEAANALLKLLEEPPPDTWFILTSSEPGGLLDTIRSRTVPLLLAPLSDDAVVDFLVGTGIDRPEAENAARLGQGAIGRALGFLPGPDDDKGRLEDLRQTSFALLRAALSTRPSDAFVAGLGQSVIKARGLLDLFTALEVWLRDLAAVAADRPELAVNQDGTRWMTRQVRERALHPETITRAFARLDDAALQARGNVYPPLIVAGLVSDLRRILAPHGTSGSSTRDH